MLGEDAAVDEDRDMACSVSGKGRGRAIREVFPAFVACSYRLNRGG
jgi:hypothetical protein